MGKVLWILTEEEKNDIQKLYEKKIALENLAKIIDPENNNLYNKIILDYGSTMGLFNNWWYVMGQKYEWEEGHWKVNFETNEIILE